MVESGLVNVRFDDFHLEVFRRLLGYCRFCRFRVRLVSWGSVLREIAKWNCLRCINTMLSCLNFHEADFCLA